MKAKNIMNECSQIVENIFFTLICSPCFVLLVLVFLGFFGLCLVDLRILMFCPA